MTDTTYAEGDYVLVVGRINRIHPTDGEYVVDFGDDACWLNPARIRGKVDVGEAHDHVVGTHLLLPSSKVARRDEDGWVLLTPGGVQQISTMTLMLDMDGVNGKPFRLDGGAA